jgi:hypothetical protein
MQTKRNIMKERLKRILLQKYKISYDISEELFGEGLLNERDCIKFLINHEYKPLMDKNIRPCYLVFYMSLIVLCCIYVNLS